MAPAFLFASHTTSWSVRRTYDRLCTHLAPIGPVFWLLDESNGAPPPDVNRLHVFTLDDLNALGYPFPVRHVVPGNAHMPLVHFAQAHPAYDRFWFIEYDVRFTGRWDVLVNAVRDDPSDLLTTTVLPQESQPDWYFWDALHHPTDHVPRAARIRSFNPLYRITRDALMHVHQAQQNGWQGHFEVLLPTLLHRAGYRLGDLSGSGDFAAPTVHRPWYLRSETFGWRPPRWRAGALTNMLYHPVKPASWFWNRARAEIREWLSHKQDGMRRRLRRVPSERSPE